MVDAEGTRTVVQGYLETHPSLLPWLDRLQVLIHRHFGIEGATRHEVFHAWSALAVGGNAELWLLIRPETLPTGTCAWFAETLGRLAGDWQRTALWAVKQAVHSVARVMGNIDLATRRFRRASPE
jgi:hypothetical protein